MTLWARAISQIWALIILFGGNRKKNKLQGEIGAYVEKDKATSFSTNFESIKSQSATNSARSYPKRVT